jgi:pimeloyl-ACP methyl ester carboxylesterase
MNQKKSLVIIMLLVVCSWWLGAAQDDNVDRTYQRIRHAELKYGYEEKILTFVHEGKTIVCTLGLPKKNGKCPIVILMPGFTGPRDEEIIPGTDERVFGRTGRILAGYGIASFRFDWRGYNDSEGNFYDASFTTEVSDTIAAMDFIQKELRHIVDSSRIGILGFSQGGLIGTLTAARDKRVDSLVLWSAPTNPAMNWAMLIPMDTIVQGVKLPDGGWMDTPIVVDGQIFCYLPLGKRFFHDLINTYPTAEIQKYKKPVLYLTGLKDTIVWPQPTMGEAYMRYHEGPHKIVTIDADHEFDYWDGPVAEKLTDAIYWSTAWIINTL